MSGAGAQPQQQADVDAARAGDEDAFRRLVEPYRPELHAHCYRMLGSLHDADDAMQDALVRAWRGLSSFQGDRPIRPWLYRIATNACLDLIAKRPKRLLPADQGPPSDPGEGAGSPVREPIWLEPYPDEELPAKDPRAAPDSSYEVREGVELAFIAALQHLPAKQRAALILREVLGLSAREAAEALGTSVAAVNSALQRARKAVAERVPARSQQTTLRDLGDDGLREAVRRYISAWERRDVDAMVAILAEDATFAMPPMPSWWQGRDAVVGFIVGTGVPRLRSIVTSANGQPAVAWYVWNGEREVYAAASLEVLGFEGDLVREITAFVMPELFPRFGLPAEL